MPQSAMYTLDGLHRLESAAYLPMDGTFAPDGRFYFTDFNNHRIRRVEPDGAVVTVAGSLYLGDGPEGDALAFGWNHPTDLAFHPLDDRLLFVAAWHNSRINVIDLRAGTVRYHCGTGTRSFGGDGGPAAEAVLDMPSSLAFLPDGSYFFSDQANHLIRAVDAAGTVTTVVGKVETRTFDDRWMPASPGVHEVTGGWPGYGGDGGPALQARLRGSEGARAFPSSKIAVSGRRLFVADTMNHLIRVVDLDKGTIEPFVGRASARAWDHDWTPSTPDIVEVRGWPGYGGDGGDRRDAQLNHPVDVEVDAEGNVFVADLENHCVRRIDAAGVVDTVAGRCGEPGFEGDGGPATEAKLYGPHGVELTPEGDLLIADSGNHVFRLVVLD